MSKTVPAERAATCRQRAEGICLRTARGARKYVTRTERQRLVAIFMARQSEADLFALTLAWTGARISEVLALTPQAFDVAAGLVAISTLKRRRAVIREVPLPTELMALLDQRYGLMAAQRDAVASWSRVWPFSRATAWRHIKATMNDAGLSGRAACPRGLRHGFGVGTLQSGVPLTLVQRWLGHARLTTTAIYAEVSGSEEQEFASGYWRWSEAA